MESITHVGLDAHKASVVVARLAPGRVEPDHWDLPYEEQAVKRLAKRLLKDAPGSVLCCYEAGPCGFHLQRQLKAAGVECVVIAPSLIPTKPGDRVKTDHRDARKLAELLRAGLLTEVHPPTEAEEALRDLCRCREDAKADQTRHRHQLGHFLLRHGFIFSGTARWSTRYMAWLRGLAFDDVALKATFDSYLLAIEQCTERLRTLEDKLSELAQQPQYRAPVAWLRCFRGIDLVTAISVVAELHDFRRFKTARELMGYLGLVPSEFTTSFHPRRGGLTKTGNGRVRRLLIEASWKARGRPALSVALRQRRRGQPAWAIALADKAMHRLHKRFWKLANKGKHVNVCVTAVARELVGFVWAMLTQGPCASNDQSCATAS